MACWVEEAEHIWLKQSGFPVQLEEPDALFWPRVQFAADYLGPIRYGETVTIDLEGEPGSSSITWSWSIRQEETPVAKGTMKTVCCTKGEGDLIPQQIPTSLQEALRNKS